MVVRVARRRCRRQRGDTSTLTALEGKDERDDRDGGYGGTTTVIQQSNNVANTQPLLWMMRRRGREGEGVSGGDGRGGQLQRCFMRKRW